LKGEGLYLLWLHGRLVWRRTRFTAEGLEISGGTDAEAFRDASCPYLGVFRAERVWGMGCS